MQQLKFHSGGIVFISDDDRLKLLWGSGEAAVGLSRPSLQVKTRPLLGSLGLGLLSPQAPLSQSIHLCVEMVASY